MSNTVSKARKAKEASIELARMSRNSKDQALEEIASSIWRERDVILSAVGRDLSVAEDEVKKGTLSQPLLNRLKLDETKVEGIVDMVRSVSALDDPVGRTISCTELDDDFELYRVTCPIGVIGAVFESRPDVLPQISSLCLKAGDSVILKGGHEAELTNKELYRVVRDASLRSGVPDGWIQLLEARREILELLRLDQYVDLLVPRGSNEFVKFVQDNTRIPVLGHSSGVCHIYVDKAADPTMAVNICYDAKVQYPAVCNAVECLLIHRDIAPVFLPMLMPRYEASSVKVRGDQRTRNVLEGFAVEAATKQDWGREYLDLIVAVRIVDSLEEAVDYINTHGSKHTDSIITEDGSAAVKFLEGVDSSTVAHNASTRFSDGYRFGLGAEVGISNGKIHARGPVGLEGLVSYKYYLLGSGQVVATYTGPNARDFKHRKTSKQWKQVSRRMAREDLR